MICFLVLHHATYNSNQYDLSLKSLQASAKTSRIVTIKEQSVLYAN